MYFGSSIDSYQFWSDLVKIFIAICGLGISLTSLFIALIAIGFTYISLNQQKIHNRLSVKPILFLNYVHVLDRIAVELQNRGSGPLIFKEFIFIGADGTKRNDLYQFFTDINEFPIKMKFGSRFINSSLLPNQSITLIDFRGEPTEKRFVTYRKKVKGCLCSITAEIVYEDIYGSKMPKYLYKFDPNN